MGGDFLCSLMHHLLLWKLAKKTSFIRLNGIPDLKFYGTEFARDICVQKSVIVCIWISARPRKPKESTIKLVRRRLENKKCLIDFRPVEIYDLSAVSWPDDLG